MCGVRCSIVEDDIARGASIVDEVRGAVCSGVSGQVTR